ncbi:MAG: hypothetical protein JW760_09940 [Spirochaetales bacterium]|nr:hypothetical protein [Spirochaetales bacterium]
MIKYPENTFFGHESPEDYKNSVLKAVQSQMLRYPESSLQDIYKSFFQDAYGPGHLLKDREKARRYFNQELTTMKSHGRYVAEPCGCGCNFFRVPMDLILGGLVSSDDYFSAFLAGVEGFITPDPVEWRKTWSTILEIIRPLQGMIKNNLKETETISAALNRGDYVMHHSLQYQKNYDPHYRIISSQYNLVKRYSLKYAATTPPESL